MITIIEGTNRAGSKTAEIAKICQNILKNMDAETQTLKLSELDFGVSPQMYSPQGQSKDISEAQDTYIKGADKWVVVLPEYNGGIPGIFKLFIDAISIRDKVENFKGKKVCLIGVADGRAGNNRGLDVMTNYFNYLGTIVYHNKLPISGISRVLTDQGLDEGTHKVLQSTLEGFHTF